MILYAKENAHSVVQSVCEQCLLRVPTCARCYLCIHILIKINCIFGRRPSYCCVGQFLLRCRVATRRRRIEGTGSVWRGHARPWTGSDVSAQERQVSHGQ